MKRVDGVLQEHGSCQPSTVPAGSEVMPVTVQSSTVRE